MTPAEFQKKLDNKIKTLKTAALIFPVASKVHDAMTQRLFEEGKGGDDNDLGQYSNKEAYYTKKQFKKKGAFKPQGKNAKKVSRTKKTFRFFSETSGSGEIIKTKVEGLAAGSGKFKNGKPRQSMFFKDGYKGLRGSQGMVTDHVNLQYSKDLRNDFAAHLVEEGESVVVKLSSEVNRDKVEWLKEKYGEKTFKHNKEEREFFKTEVTKKLIAYLNK